MASLSHPPGLPTLWHAIEAFVSNLFCRLLRPTCGRRLNRRGDAQSIPHRDQQHFGSLDDQLLNDLGLQRSEIRAAEYGILPGDQALHHEDDAAKREEDDDAGPSSPPQA